MVYGNQVDEARDHQRTAGLVVDVLLEDEAEVGVGLDGRADLDGIFQLGALFEGHIGLVGYEACAYFVGEADELIGADEVLTSYTVGTWLGKLNIWVVSS